ncbi:MAG: SDR family oxidoreductase, partial [Candidatus Methanofastidiosa archaeon]|nr:SDR family oxidoreductase [Candidatus Methanofastidiosa archaeon]
MIKHRKIFPDLFSLEEKVALLNGVGGLLGPFHLAALVEAGARVIATDVSIPLELHSQYNSYPVDFLEMDVTDENSIKSIHDYILEKYGYIDILVNNAAINEKFEDPTNILFESKFENLSTDRWNRVVEVNLTGVFLTCKVFGATMAQRKKGSIINIASTYAIVAPKQELYKDSEGNQLFYKSPAYPVTKAGVLHLTRFLASWWGEKGVRVNALTPGGIENGQHEDFIANYKMSTPLRRMAKPWDYQGALIFLASDASSY